MANFALINFVLLSCISCGLSITINDFFGFGNLRQARPEEPRVVEVIRWRQPVCLTPAPGVLPCMVSLTNSQPQTQVYEHHQQYSKKTPQDDLRTELTNDDSAFDSSSSESKEKGDYHLKRSARATLLPKLFSPRVVRAVQLENMGSSTLEDPLIQETRRGRYLRIGPQMARASTRRQTVYVTKVVDSPVVATLVAATCLPDIGIPLCDEIPNSNDRPGYYHESQTVVHQTSVTSTPPVYGNWPTTTQNHSSAIPSNYNNNNGQQSTTNQPNQPIQPNQPNQPTQPTQPNQPNQPNQQIIQNIVDFLNPPNIVHTNQTPEVKPVIVVQPTPLPGIFDGINAFLMPNGTWFFNQNGNGTGFPGIPGLGQFPQLPQFQLPQLPQIPGLQDILNRPENDISDPPNILSIFNLTNNQPGAGPPTQSPGVFGGLFASPTGPAGIDNSTTSTTTSTTTTSTTPSFLGGIGNIFRPTNRPLVIESPDQRPIVVEKPVYVVEQPIIPGLADILQIPSRPVHLNSNEDPQVISDPVYVLQRPEPGQLPFVGGLLPNLNIFGSPSSTPSTATSTSAPQLFSSQNQPGGLNPGRVHIDPEVAGATDSEISQSSHGNSKSSATVSFAVVQNSDPVYSGANLAESSTTQGSNLYENDLLDGSLSQIVNAESELEGSGIADENYPTEDVLDTSLIAQDEAHQERESSYKNINDDLVKDKIDNEAR